LGYYHNFATNKDRNYTLFGILPLFRAVEKETLQLTVSEHIWQIIIELVVEIADILSLAPEELILEIVSENQRLAKFINLKPPRQAG
jgi:hypothetical protein